MNLSKRKIGNFTLFVDKDDPGISATLKKPKYFRKWHREPEFMDIIAQSLKKDDHVLDLGANIGYTSLVMLNIIGKNGLITAVEPSPKNFKILSKLVKENKIEKNIKLKNIAISNIEGEINFHLSNESNLHSIQKTNYSVEKITIKSTTIDSLYKNKKSPSFIKMDIEGGELEALQGMRNLIADHSKKIKILMEIHPMYYDHENFKKELQNLFKNKFTAKYLVSAGTAYPDFLILRGYKPSKVYSTGDFQRGVYENVDEETILESCCKDHSQIVKRRRVGMFKHFIKNPNHKIKRKFKTSKIVRALLFER